MGFFSKVWKGLKKGFKKIGRVVKKGFQKFGKFMDKIGILGQIAMAFILPGIGNALIGGLGSMFGFQGITSLSQLAGNLAGSTNIFAKALGQTIGIGMQAVNVIKAPFDAVTSLMTNFGKSAANGMSRIFGGKNVFSGHSFTKAMSADFNNIMGGIKGTKWRAVKASKMGIEEAIANGTMPKVHDAAGDIIDFEKTKITATAEGYLDPSKVGTFKTTTETQYRRSEDGPWINETDLQPEDYVEGPGKVLKDTIQTREVSYEQAYRATTVPEIEVTGSGLPKKSQGDIWDEYRRKVDAAGVNIGEEDFAAIKPKPSEEPSMIAKAGAVLEQKAISTGIDYAAGQLGIGPYAEADPLDASYATAPYQDSLLVAQQQQETLAAGFTPQQYGAMEYNMRNAINNSSGWEAWGGYTWRDWTQRLGPAA